MKPSCLWPEVLHCPFDQLPLSPSPTQLRCPQGHSFDIARDGYVNLLPVHHKKTKDPGDNKVMVQARHDFLAAGHYDRIAQAVNALCIQHLAAAQTPRRILDTGCGEGFYLRQLDQALQTEVIERELIGLDISKHAIQKAAKTRQDICWLVASGKQAPIQAHSLDLILCLFGFCFYADFAHLLKPSGLLLRVDAGPTHLIELRERIYPELKSARSFHYSEAEQAGFKLETEQILQFKLPRLCRETLQQLLAMTPHLYRANKDMLAQLDADELPELSVDVGVRLFRR